MFFRRKPKPETLPEKFSRVLAFKAEMIASAPGRIRQLVNAGDIRLALENHSHLVADWSDVVVMQWRRGDDPRPAIGQARQAYRAMLAERDRLDPEHAIALSAIAGITDWDLVYSLFWLNNEPAEPLLHIPRMLDERYFAYARYLLHRTTGSAVPDQLAEAVERYKQSGSGLVDRNFSDLVALLEAEEPAAGPLAARIAASWPKRRRLAFYNTSAPLNAGFDASNDLAVDYQLACIVHARGWQFTDSPHYWQWG